ncbi:MAG: YncE family protein [Mycobacteriales bacterium]
MMSRRSRCSVLLVLLALMLSACGNGTSHSARHEPNVKRFPAAEPSNAPELTQPPTGRLISIGPGAEGAVADAQTHLVAVGLRDPSRLALVDGRTGTPVHDVALPGHLRHLQLRGPGGPVIVPAESADAVLEVSLPSGTISPPVHVGKSPHDATATSSGTLVVGNEFGGTVSVVESGTVTHTFGDATQPGGLAAVGDTVGMIDVSENTLTIYDIKRLQQLAELPAGRGPTHTTADKHGRLAVVDTRGGALLIYELGSKPHQVARLSLPGGPYGMAYDPIRDRLWVTLTATNELVGIDMSGKSPKVTQRLPTLRQPNTVAIDSSTGRLFVASPTQGELELIDP